MKLSCAIVSRILGTRTVGDSMPAWVNRHVSHCAKCRSESVEYARLRTVLSEAFENAESPSIEWNDLKSILAVRTRPARLVPALAVGALAALVVAVVSVGMALHNGTTKLAVRPQSHDRGVIVLHDSNVGTKKTPEPIVVPPKTRANAHDTHPVRDTAPQRLTHRRMTPLRLQARLPDSPAPHQPGPSVDKGSTVAALAAGPLAPRYTVVGAEEHVIKVVGASQDGAPSSSDTHYVIRTTDTGDDRQVALL